MNEGTIVFLMSLLIVFFIKKETRFQSLNSGRETGHWAMSPPKFEIFLIPLYFLRSKILSGSATREAIRISSLLY